jgi:hypothetical protein
LRFREKGHNISAEIAKACSQESALHCAAGS